MVRLPLATSFAFNPSKARETLFQFLMGMFGAAVLMLFFHVLEPPRSIATVDVSGMINRFVKTTTDAKLPPDQLQKRVNAFGHALDSTLKKMVRERQLVLLPKEAVIAGAKDISRDVEAKINAQLTASDHRQATPS